MFKSSKWISSFSQLDLTSLQFDQLEPHARCPDELDAVWNWWLFWIVKQNLKSAHGCLPIDTCRQLKSEAGFCNLAEVNGWRVWIPNHHIKLKSCQAYIQQYSAIFSILVTKPDIPPIPRGCAAHRTLGAAALDQLDQSFGLRWHACTTASQRHLGPLRRIRQAEVLRPKVVGEIFGHC